MKKNILAENMRRFGTKNLTEQDLNSSVQVKRIASDDLGDGEFEDNFVVNGKYKVEVYRTDEDGFSSTSAYFGGEDIMEDEDDTSLFGGVSNANVYQAILDFYEKKKDLTEQSDDEQSQRDLENQRKRIVSIKRSVNAIKRRNTDMSGFEEALLDLIQGNVDEPWEQGRQDITDQILKMYPIAKTNTNWKGILRDITNGISQTFKHARDMKAGDTADYGYNVSARNGGKLPGGNL